MKKIVVVIFSNKLYYINCVVVVVVANYRNSVRKASRHNFLCNF